MAQNFLNWSNFLLFALKSAGIVTESIYMTGEYVFRKYSQTVQNSRHYPGHNN